MSTNHDWSKLCPDLLRKIFEGLKSKDYHRARTVCSNWYSVSTTCKPPLYPWQLLFNKYSTLLVDPEDDKIHKIEHPDLDLLENYCIASFGNWLLMVDRRLVFNLLNVFTRETIDLPPMELSVLGYNDLDKWDYFIERSDINSAVMWINERTRDYVVAWVYKRNILFSYKKGEETWQGNLQGTKCYDLGFKDNKLYVLTLDNCIKVLDFSGDFPRDAVENPYYNIQFGFNMGRGECIWKRRVMITNSGEVMVIQSSRMYNEAKYLFRIFKINLESRKWEIVDSLGDEMYIFGHGVTVRTPVNGGSIFFVEDDLWPGKRKSGVFDLATSTITWAKQVGDSYFEAQRWFVPGYA